MKTMDKVIAATLGALSFCGVATASYAGSELFPGISTGIPLGAAPPEGVYLVQLPSYGYRDSTPGVNVGVLAPAWIIWTTPWTLAGGHLVFDTVSGMANVNVHGVLNRGGFGNPLVDAQLKWDLGNGFFGGFQAGAYLPVQDELNLIGVTRNFASFQGVAALSYLKDGWDLTATVIYGTGQNGSVLDPGSWGSDWINLDLTATHKFGKFEFGLVAFGSSDLSSPYHGYQQVSQFALGPLVGYNFGTVDLQLKFTRDVAEHNYGGYDSRMWANIVVPLWVAPKAEPVVAAKY